MKDERRNYKTGSDFPPFGFPSLAEHNFPMILQAEYGYRVTDTDPKGRVCKLHISADFVDCTDATPTFLSHCDGKCFVS